MLSGKCIVLGVSGGIAVYKAVEVLRQLIKAGAEVHVVMTQHATEFVTPLTFQTLSNNPVHTELFNLYQEREIGHISLADRADLFLVVPATANLIGKVAHGIADDLLTTTLMATRAKVLFAPAMNVNMWENRIYQDNQKRLEELGYSFIEPATGSLACGWEGKGKLPDPGEIVAYAETLLGPDDLSGETVLVTAGPTREPIDPVRYLSNNSSGRMGYAIAKAALERGAEVILITGPTAIDPPGGVTLERVTTAEEMLKAVTGHFSAATILIKAAAVADYRPEDCPASKIKKSNHTLGTLSLVENPDILATVAARKKGQIVVGFAAETDNIVENAGKKLGKKNLDLIVANDVTKAGAGFDVETNIVRLIYPDGRIDSLEKMTKDAVAHRLLDAVLVLKKKG